MKRFNRIVSIGIFAAMTAGAAISSGCGNPLDDAITSFRYNGTVKLNGQALDQGVGTFTVVIDSSYILPTSDNPAGGTQSKDYPITLSPGGRFTVSQAVFGYPTMSDFDVTEVSITLIGGDGTNYVATEESPTTNFNNGIYTRTGTFNLHTPVVASAEDGLKRMLRRFTHSNVGTRPASVSGRAFSGRPEGAIATGESVGSAGSARSI